MISEDFNSEYDFIELKSYLCVRYPKQCIEIWQRWVTYSRLIPMTRSMRTKNGCDNTGVYRWSRKSAPTRRSGRSGNNSCTGDVRGPARRGSRVTQVVQPYHATATNHQATGNEEGHVAGGARKDHRGYVQQRPSHRRYLENERL